MLKSTGKVDIQIGSINIENKDVLILEDIVDSGQTLKALTNDLKKFKPNSIEIATFLSKPLERITDIQVKYVGIEIPSKFVVGYGLDYAEYGRYLKDIYSLKSNII
jgi:hypoxanthine phosphoribosyltransferase